MSDTTTATVAVIPEPAANDGLTDEALAAIFGDEAAADDEPGGNDTELEEPKTATEAQPVTVADPAASATDTIDLSTLDDAAVEPAKVESAVTPASALTQKIQEYIPNEDVLGMVVNSHQRMTQLEQSLSRNDMSGVVQALGNQGTNALLDAIYANEHLRNAFVDRVIEESTGQKKDPQVAQLMNEVNGLKQFIQSGVQQQQQTAAQAARQRQAEGLNSTISGIFEQVRFPKDDRHALQQSLMTDAVMTKLAREGNLEKAMKGDVRVVRAALKPLLENFVKTDKAITVATAEKRAQLEQKPKLVSPESGASAAGGSKDDELDIFQQAANEVNRLRKKGR